jgi:hypothetical protein
MAFLSERAAADPTVAFSLGVEQRYPLRLAPELPALARLYADACGDPWDPEELVDTAALARVATDPGAAVAARTWAWAAQREYRGITESNALLVRMCIETAREPELKYLLTTRAQTRALAAEACWSVASALAAGDEEGAGGGAGSGGVTSSGGAPGSADHTARALLHARVSADAAFIGHVLVGDSVGAAWWRAVAGSDNAAVSVVGARLLRDRERMVAFGWAYVEARMPGFDDASLGAVSDAVADLVSDALEHTDLPPDGRDHAVALGAPPVGDARRAALDAVADTVEGLRTRGMPIALPSDTRRAP